MSQIVLPELFAIQQISEIVSTLSVDERRRVAAWLTEYASQDGVAQTASEEPNVPEASDVFVAPDASDAADADGSAQQNYTTFAEFYAAAAPKKGAQKAAVAGYWLETREGQRSWKASEVNKLLKSIDVKVSSMSIVLTNAVKAKAPLVLELERLGDSERSRKTFCLSEDGLAYVEGQLA